MNTMTSPLPASLQHAEAAEGDLDARIRQAELRLIAREENLQRRVASLGGRVREAARPSRLLVPIAGAAVAVLTVWWLWRRRAPAQQPASPAEASVIPRGSGPWMGLLGLVVPLLPDRWRARLNPATVSTVMAIAGTVLEKMRQRAPAVPLPTVETVAPTQLVGDWHELAHLGGQPRHAGLPTVRFAARDDGRLTLQTDGAAHGLVEPVPGSGGARLRVSDWPAALHWLPLAWRELGVLHLDEARGELLLGSPDRDTLHVLSRQPALQPQRLEWLLVLARDLGYAVDRLLLPDPA